MSDPTTAGQAPQGKTLWWKDAVVYQLYVRSFADSNGDGRGDLEGIRSRLDHLRDLGVNAIWLTPCFPSPQRDHGYDVADYFDIDATYGTLDDFDRLVAAASDRSIRILMDVVPNHCSSEHAWFQAALKAPPGSPERARYWFRDGKGPGGNEPPNNWRAIFGGPAWTRVTEADGTPGQWYEHSFTPYQPDFNWYNPEVIEYFDRMLTFWFDRGVEGFRVDAVPVLGKHPDMPDAPPAPPGLTEAQLWRHNIYAHFYPTGHDVWKRWRRVIDDYERSHPGRHLVTISESYGPPQRAAQVHAGRRVPPVVRLRLDVGHMAGCADQGGDHRLARHARLGGRVPGLDVEQSRHAAHRHPPRPAQRHRSVGIHRQQPRLRRCSRRSRARTPPGPGCGNSGGGPARRLLPLPGRRARPRGDARHARRGQGRPAVHQDRWQGARPRRLPCADPMDGRPDDVVRVLAGGGRAMAAAATGLGGVVGRASSHRPALDAGLVPHGVGPPPAAVGRAAVGRDRSSRLPRLPA